MTRKQRQLLETIGKDVVSNIGKKGERAQAGVVQAVLPDGRVVVKDRELGQLAVWNKGTWKVAQSTPTRPGWAARLPLPSLRAKISKLQDSGYLIVSRAAILLPFRRG